MAPYPHAPPHPETVAMFASGLLDAIEVSNSRPTEYADEPWIGQNTDWHIHHAQRHIDEAWIAERYKSRSWLADDGTPELAHAVVRGMMGLWQWRKEQVK